MDFRLLTAILIVVYSSGCAPIKNQQRLNYTTIQASPHRNSDCAKAETNRAERLLQRGEIDKAEQALQLALAADVSFGPAHNNLGELLFSKGNYYLAAWEFEFAGRLMPDRPEPFNNLGLVYEITGKLDEAIGFFETAHELQPDDPQFLGNLVRSRLRRGDRDEDTQHLLSELVLRETRPDWAAWAQEENALFQQSPGNMPPLAAPVRSHSPRPTEAELLPHPAPVISPP